MHMTVNMSAIDPDDFSGYVQAIYNMMKHSPYVTVGEYFMTLYDEDLDELLEAIERITVPVGMEDPTAVENIMMLTMLLRTAEGTPDVTETELHRAIGIVCTFAAMERLARLGQVEVFHQNMSIADDPLANSRPIIRKI
jgi:hypothetical protein